MDWIKLKNKALIKKSVKAPQVVLQPCPSLNEETEVKQSLLPTSEKSCLKNDERKRGDPSRRIRWKDDYGNVLVQVKIYQPDFDAYDESDDDVDFTDFCNCIIM